jgi:hypothetical protein
MARRIIDIGTISNDGTGDSIRDSFRKVNDNFRDLYGSLGLGERLTFIGLDDTPNSYEGIIETLNATPILTVNNTGTGLQFKKLVGGNGINIEYNPAVNGDEEPGSSIEIQNTFDSLTALTSPDPDIFTNVGSLSLRSGINQYRIRDLPVYDRTWNPGDPGSPGGPRNNTEAVSKSYSDAFVSRNGVDHVNPATGLRDSAFGRMNGPLILSRDPEGDDDELYDGLIAATKRYVDRAAFGSVTNIYVSNSGSDSRSGLSRDLQGSSLAYAFSSIEAALKKAEEIILESPVDIGPYKKTLTYGNNVSNKCTLDFIEVSPDSGTGFDADVVMTLDTIAFSLDEEGNEVRGINYFPGDIIEIPGGSISQNGGRIRILVLTTTGSSGSSGPGSISTFRIITGGSYIELPDSGVSLASNDIVVSGEPPTGAIGQGARFDFTFKVNSIEINDTGSGYGLVSVRFENDPEDSSGSGAFGTADVVDGEIVSITITDQGSGFTRVPTVVATLPRFCLFTNGERTDFTGNVLSNDPVAFRSRDIKEGLYLKGEISGAIAQILNHNGDLGNSDGTAAIDQGVSPVQHRINGDVYELFDVDIQIGKFIIGEPISYGDITITRQVSVLIESGVYEENYPLKVPRNVAIVGDEFRRVLIKPKSGMSTSSWAFNKFRRDLTVGARISKDAEPDIYNSTLSRSTDDSRDFYITKESLPTGVEPFAGWVIQIDPDDDGPSFPIVNVDGDSTEWRITWSGDAVTFASGTKVKILSSGQIFEPNDLLTIGDRLFGYHYLTDSSQPVYPRINNKGSFRSAAYLLEVNRSFIQEEVVLWIDDQINQQLITPINWADFEYNRSLCRRDIGLLIDAMAFDLKYGEYSRTVSAALKYYQNASGLIAITEQLPQTVAALERFNIICQYVLNNRVIPADLQPVNPGFQNPFRQTIDFAFVAEVGSVVSIDDLEAETPVYNNGAVYELIQSIIDVISDVDLNRPKDNDELDVFLCNDAVIVRAVTCQGHGGFMMVLDPTGQILTKSPYAQESASFSKSINKQKFAGGQLVDGFAGNLQFKHQGSTLELKRAIPLEGFGSNYQIGDILEISGGDFLRSAKLLVVQVDGGAPTLVRIVDPGNYTSAENIDLLNNIPVTVEGDGSGAVFSLELSVVRLSVSDIVRFPQLPSSFIVNDEVYRINYVRDYVYNPLGSTATLVLDQTTPFPFAPGSQECTISVGNPAVITKSNHRLQLGATIVFEVSEGGELPEGIEAGREYYVLFEGLTDNTFRITDTPGTLTPVETTSAGSGTFTYQRIYEIITPGNRSMLSNDYTQINDLGYGLVATNGGLIEAVSVFTYYNWISYYSINGGQIRSVGGSSAHGRYALVAQGSDPLELPTPTNLWEELSQGATVYNPGDARFVNVEGGTLIWVTGYEYVPLNQSEIEIDHPTEGLTRYAVGAVEIDEFEPTVTRLTIVTEDGLKEPVADGTDVTIRCLGNIVLTGDLVDVAVRPSTGLIMNELPREVYRVLQFDSYDDPNDPYEFDLVGAAPTNTLVDISGSFRIRDGYEISVSSVGGTLPAPLEPLVVGANTRNTYFVINSDPNTQTFQISLTKNGDPITLTSSGSGTLNYEVYGLTTTRLRENYKYIGLSTFEPGKFSGNSLTGDGSCTFTIGASLTVNAAGHALSNGDVIKFEVSDRETDVLPTPLSVFRKYHVINSVAGTSFQVSTEPGGPAVVGTSAGTGTFYYGKILGNRGDTQIVVDPVSASDENRIIGSRFVFLGTEYIVTDYEKEGSPIPGTVQTGRVYGLVTLNQALDISKKSPLQFPSVVTMFAGGSAGETGTDGALTIRISLTRVTSHDLLDIGTGSYKETNYPNEIYGPSENPVNELRETQERTVGRVFFVTTDQFGNFKVGPFFKVDQGTGTVTFSANIAISNLDGLGFKRGVTISEFSTDTGLADNAIDKVPTEFAVRTYIERRLGTTHDGDSVASGDLIPPFIGGFMDLQGQQQMRGNLNLGDKNIVNLADPVLPRDAVNRQFLRFSNLNDLTITPAGAPPISNILAFTGTGTNMVNVSVTGDIGLTYTSGNTITAAITANSIVDADVNSSAAIVQSKLSMNLANTFDEDSETAGWSGTDPKTQADLGLAKFSDENFETTSGYVRIKNNGVVLAELQQIPSGVVLGNNTGSVGTVQTVSLSDITSSGGAVMKSQFGASTGFIRKTNTETNPAAMTFAIVEMQSNYTSAANNRLVVRDANGDIGARYITADRLLIGTGVASNNEAIVRNVVGTGGNIRYFGYNQEGGLLINRGTNANDRFTEYINDSHLFRTASGGSLAPIQASSVQTTTLTTGGNTTAGTITGRWTLSGTSPNESRLQATYSADLAEYYEGDKEYEVGTVLVFGGDKEVTLTNKQGDTRVAGVVSNTAAFVMYDACPGYKNLIALQGRVPCKVVGKIRKGDLLVTSRIPGVAVATETAQAGTIVGKALNNYDSDHIGTIEVAVGRN